MRNRFFNIIDSSSNYKMPVTLNNLIIDYIFASPISLNFFAQLLNFPCDIVEMMLSYVFENPRLEILQYNLGIEIDVLPIMHEQKKNNEENQISWNHLDSNFRGCLAMQSVEIADYVFQGFLNEFPLFPKFSLTTNTKIVSQIDLVYKFELIAYKILNREYKQFIDGIALPDKSKLERFDREYEFLQAIFTHEKCLLSVLVNRKKAKESKPIIGHVFAYSDYSNHVRPEAFARFFSTAEYYLNNGSFYDSLEPCMSFDDFKLFCVTEEKVAKRLFKHKIMIESLNSFVIDNSWDIRVMACHHRHFADWLFSRRDVLKKMKPEYVDAIANYHKINNPLETRSLKNLFF